QWKGPQVVLCGSIDLIKDEVSPVTRPVAGKFVHRRFEEHIFRGGAAGRLPINLEVTAAIAGERDRCAIGRPDRVTVLARVEGEARGTASSEVVLPHVIGSGLRIELVDGECAAVR